MLVLLRDHVDKISEEHDDEKGSEAADNFIQNSSNTSQRRHQVHVPDIHEFEDPLLELEPQIDSVRVPRPLFLVILQVLSLPHVIFRADLYLLVDGLRDKEHIYPQNLLFLGIRHILLLDGLWNRFENGGLDLGLSDGDSVALLQHHRVAIRSKLVKSLFV